MATEILAVGTAAADSSDVVIAAGAQLTVSLKGSVATPRGEVYIKLKDDGGVYWPFARLTAEVPQVILPGAGTYRFSRIEGAGQCGVFSG